MAEEETVKEVAKPEPESTVEVPKVTEEPPTVVEQKEPEAVVELNVNTQLLHFIYPSILFIYYFISEHKCN